MQPWCACVRACVSQRASERASKCLRVHQIECARACDGALCTKIQQRAVSAHTQRLCTQVCSLLHPSATRAGQPSRPKKHHRRLTMRYHLHASRYRVVKNVQNSVELSKPISVDPQATGRSSKVCELAAQSSRAEVDLDGRYCCRLKVGGRCDLFPSHNSKLYSIYKVPVKRF